MMAHISTDYVSDGTSQRPYRPEGTTGPVSVYRKSKLAGEHAARAALPDALTVRTAWVYAAGGANSVTTMLRLMAACDELKIVAGQFGTLTHAASLARAIWKLAEARAQGIYHYTNTGEASWYDFAVAIEAGARAMAMIDGCTVLPIATADYPTAAQRPTRSRLECEATYAIIGPARHWRDELRAMLAQQKALS